MNGCVENSLEDNPFTVWTDKALNIDFSFNKPQSFRLCLGGVEGSILDIYRGEYEFNRFAVKLHTHRGSLKDTAKIIYGKNLTDLKQDESIENTITGIVPYWSSTVTQTNDEGTSTSESVEVVVTLPEYVLESEYADKFPYRRTAVVDLSEYFQEKPTVDELRTRANQYMKDNLTGLPTVSLTVSFIDLARSEENKDFASEIVYLGDQVPVYFEKLGISAKAEITSMTYDVLADRYDSLTLGTVSSSLSKTLNEISKKQDTVVTQTNLQSALILAQKIMAGGAGGYIVTKYFNGHPAETFYGDTDNVDTMVNVIRINKNGIAFSNSGISGPYVSAWTIDGKFNANFIQAGKISGSFIEANSLQIGSFDEATTNTITSGLSEAVTEWYVSTSPTEPIGGEWSETSPQWAENNYIWQRLKTINKKGEISYSEPSCVQGDKGSTGIRNLIRNSKTMIFESYGLVSSSISSFFTDESGNILTDELMNRFIV